MKVMIKNITLMILFTFFSMAAFAKEKVEDNTQATLTKSNVILFDEILIDSPAEKIWPELLDFVSWYFKGQRIEHVKGQKNKVGNTLVVNNVLRHEIVSIRPMKSVVWKTCIIASCEKDLVFSDFSIQDISGKTKFTQNVYSQGFWSENDAKQMLQDTSNGKVPDAVRKTTLMFKAYIEQLK